MVNTRMIYVRLTRSQHERIKQNTRDSGFESISSYVRFMAIDPDLKMQQRIYEIHQHLLGGRDVDKVRPKKTKEGMD